MTRFLVPLLAALALAAPAKAAEFVFGLGADDIDGPRDGAAAVQLEYHLDPFATFSWGSVSGMVAAEVDSDSDIWVGAGISSRWTVSPHWFLEGSFAAGYYEPGSRGNDLGGNLHFRTLVGAGYRFDNGHRISIAADHLSNGGIETRNPGRNSVFLRYGLAF
jgi:hypothetical protein